MQSNSLVWFLVVLLALMLGREITCWYFKLTKIVTLLTDVNTHLAQLRGERLHADRISVPPPAVVESRPGVEDVAAR